MVSTPYGLPSAPIVFGEICSKTVAFLARHGGGHTIPPHKVNYCANLWALKSVGVKKIIAIAAVGGIRDDMTPGKLAFPDQIIDYTSSRVNTFFEDKHSPVTHIDFTYPYNEALRESLIEISRNEGLGSCEDGTYGATQGPRLETAAEIKRMEQDGCAIVGMTGMPEAALARELELDYSCCAVIANWAAGKRDGEITMEDIEEHLKEGMEKVRVLLENALPVI
jgi:5'-deoxy-5'-methylthioadenosine phosphorylase